MHDVVILEAAHDVGDCIGLTDVAEELVPETLTLRRTGDQPCDVDELHHRGDDLPRLHDLGDVVQARVRDLGDPGVRIDRGERVVLGGDLAAGQCVEQRRLADVRQPDDSAGDPHGSRLPSRRNRADLAPVHA